MKTMLFVIAIMAFVCLPLYAQDKPVVQEEKSQQPCEKADVVKKIYHVTIDGVKVKITVSGAPQVMEKFSNKEFNIRKEVVGLHQDIARIQQRLKRIYQELDIHCPAMEKAFSKWVECNQKQIKKQQKKLEECKEQCKAIEQKKQLHELKQATEKAIEKPVMVTPAVPETKTETAPVAPETKTETAPVAPETKTETAPVAPETKTETAPVAPETKTETAPVEKPVAPETKTEPK